MVAGAVADVLVLVQAGAGVLVDVETVISDSSALDDEAAVGSAALLLE